MRPPAGLCATCARARVVGNRRGSRFWMCTRSADDSRYPRYPRIPVVRCPGYDPGVAPQGREEEKRGAAGAPGHDEEET